MYSQYAAFTPGQGVTEGLVYYLRLDEGQGSLLRERALQQHSTQCYGSWSYVPNPRLSQLGSSALAQNVFCNGEYRFGFNGQEKDDEIKGSGNSIEFKFRIYDPRLGRFLSVDPLTKEYPWYTPYQFAGNTPIQAKDLEGAEPDFVIKKMEAQGMRPSEQKAAWDNFWGAAMIHVSGNREIAEKAAQNSGLPGLHNGPADALRHGLFNALNTQVAGEKTAKALGDAHEKDRPEQPEQEKIMDLHNNAVGRQIAKENPNATPSQLARKLIEKIEKGEMLMLDDKGKAVPTAITPEQKSQAYDNISEMYVDGDKQGTEYEDKDKK